MNYRDRYVISNRHFRWRIRVGGPRRTICEPIHLSFKFVEADGKEKKASGSVAQK
jgi:hypothetical protein